MLLMALVAGAGEVLPLVALSALCHELGHLTALKLVGAKVEQIRLTAFGAEIRADTRYLSYGREIFCTLAGPAVNLFLAVVLGFDLKDAAAIGIIGAADGPTSLLVSQVLKSNYIGPIAVAAYSYMALVPIVQPFAIRLVTTKKERRIHMEYYPGQVSKSVRIVFPIIVTFIVGLIAPSAVSLVGFLMFGNLLRECGVLSTLSDTAQNVLANLITLFLGITISFSMQAEQFIQLDTILIMVIGLFAFVFDTIGGVCFAKIMNLFLKKKVNPMIGAAGISAFPMATRVVQKMAQKEDPTNILIMQAAGANVAGQIASVVAGGLIIGLVSAYL